MSTELDTVLNAYIYESKRGEGETDPARKYRATLPGYSPSVAYFPTKTEAAEAILKACGITTIWRREEVTG
jgi:hypothetical protein